MIRNMSARRPGSRGRDISLDGRLLARGDKHSVAVWDVDKWSKKECYLFQKKNYIYIFSHSFFFEIFLPDFFPSFSSSLLIFFLLLYTKQN